MITKIQIQGNIPGICIENISWKILLQIFVNVYLINRFYIYIYN